MAEIFARLVAPDHGFHFPGTGHGLLHTPDVRQTGMGHHQVSAGVVHAQMLLAQPLDQPVVIRCVQNVMQRILALRAVAAKRDRQQMQVVVAQYHNGGIAQAFDVAQGFQ